MAEKKRPNVVPVSFKNNLLDQILLDWLYDQGDIVGNSAYVKQLLKEDMEKHQKNPKDN